MSRASNGALVFSYLKAATEPRTIWEIASDTKLSISQVRNAFSHIREVLIPLHGEPLVYKAFFINRSSGWAQHTYELSPTAKAVKEYGAYRLRIHAKQLRNLTATVQAGAEKFGDSELAVMAHAIRQAADTAEFVEKQLLGAP